MNPFEALPFPFGYILGEAIDDWANKEDDVPCERCGYPMTYLVADEQIPERFYCRYCEQLVVNRNGQWVAEPVRDTYWEDYYPGI